MKNNQSNAGAFSGTAERRLSLDLSLGHHDMIDELGRAFGSSSSKTETVRKVLEHVYGELACVSDGYEICLHDRKSGSYIRMYGSPFAILVSRMKTREQASEGAVKEPVPSTTS